MDNSACQIPMELISYGQMGIGRKHPIVSMFLKKTGRAGLGR